eukprot:jgi/Chrzof1/6357/Cz18g05160.t1
MTQDLRHTKMIIWSPHVDQLLPNQTKTFFESYKQYIEVRAWNYSQQIIGTPWEKDPFFGDHALVQKHLDTSATYADIVRLLLLHNYGGLWMDDDVIFLQDWYRLLAISYQFVPRWNNNHVLYMLPKSKLTTRLLQVATTIPMNAQD